MADFHSIVRPHLEMALVGATSQCRMSPYSQVLKALVLLQSHRPKPAPLPCQRFWQPSEAVCPSASFFIVCSLPAGLAASSPRAGALMWRARSSTSESDLMDGHSQATVREQMARKRETCFEPCTNRLPTPHRSGEAQTAMVLSLSV